ncbi:L-dehydroascorbate transporter large permease subunit [uncultured Clostridium sp.]|uniref:TRAP transporter permease n=1 Tax=Muricoprocola aceti TaxID=2981772 RepID=A0ABT2SH07_9FIRM|nr:TRAP transporter permease [Muricoprocola aceti]MCI7227844.1 TRAP transporter permease [Lachnospiraceae bacterium]SCG90758.1 L-dehydroascorbate transporter large permease subunit [uncultured Clostridium sp.]MCU6723777.1 TRAP transporter permease [Muricoprocola aceti]MDD7435085.1 TRAP transporter permease [Lachnospiraceae bacterium]MDY3342128.1 TRAP transporter permease [Lachnospiraceae bacterium]
MSDMEKKSSAANVEVGSAADVDEVLKKYDRESNTRIWEGKPKLVIRWLMVFFSLYSIYVTLFSTAMRQIRLMNFLGMILVIGYLNFPAKKGTQKVNHMPWYDILIMAVGAFGFFYASIHGAELANLRPKFIRGDMFLLVIACLSILAMMELCRRSVGVPILIVVGILLVYTFVTVDPTKVIYDQFYATSGIMNTPIDVCAKYIVVFLIFGAFLERTGISTFFIDLANSIAGATAGGPAKVAVISSGLCGMVSGSSVGNTVTTGSVTIPMMKKTGYQSEFAGAVEAAASTGGQIMPPIMGAAAFLMAEYMGVSYAEVAYRALLPAILYFVGIYIAVHLEAKKLGLKGIPKDQLPKFSVLIRKIYLLFPLVLLVVLVSTNTRSMQFSASVAIVATILVGLFNKDDRITFTKIIDALESGAKGTISVAVACAMAGIVAGCVTSTGLASKMITAIVSVANGHAMIALVLTMLCCIVLGMGVPTTATYCIMAATCAPILVSPEIGIPVISAHFFVFYFGIVADITPPVALAAYAGSAIAKSSPMKTAFTATRLAIAGFIVPYICALSPAMLLIDAGPAEVVMIVITSLIGIFGVAAGLSGFVYKKMNPLMRALIVVGGITLLIPGTMTDVIGFVMVGGVILLQRLGAKKQAAA